MVAFVELDITRFIEQCSAAHRDAGQSGEPLAALAWARQQGIITHAEWSEAVLHLTRG